MRLRDLFRRRPAAPLLVEADPGRVVVLPEGTILVQRAPPVTCSEAGRGGYIVRHDRERAKIRETTIKLAEQIGQPEKADPLR